MLLIAFVDVKKENNMFLCSSSQPMPQSGSALSFPEALGVVGVVLPDTNPLLSMVTLVGAAVATGNAIIIIPSKKNPLSSLEFIQVSLKMLREEENI